MIQQIATYFRVGLRSIREHSSLLLPALLLVLIPAAFLWTGQHFLDLSIDRSARLEKERVNSLHDGISLAYRANVESGLLSTYLEDLHKTDQGLQGVEVLTLTDGTTTTLIRVGDLEQSVVDPVTPLAVAQPGTSFIFETSFHSIRHWIGVRAVSKDGTTVIIRTDHTMGAVDTYFASRVRDAYLILIFIIGALLLLLWRQVRIVDYAALYTKLNRAHETMMLFTNMTAHELRTPLTAIRGYASMIREDAEATPAIMTHAGQIETSSSNLIALIGDLLDVARLQSGKMSFITSPVDLETVIVHVITSLLPLAKEHGLFLKREPHEYERPTTIADEKRLVQVLTNVVSNALKYTKTGGITVSLTRKKEWFEIRIKDTGMGISAENQKKLFAPYFRVNSVEVNATTGTGLGMWITKRMVEEMGGSIDVESIEGVGTHIVVRFKAANA